MTTTRYFHEGERQIQAEAGVDSDAYEIGAAEGMQPEMVAHEVEFIEARTFSMAASVDRHGSPWASPLLDTGAGIFRVVDELTIDLRPATASADPLRANVEDNGHLGLLFIDPSKRRRAKSLGRGAIVESGAIRYSQTRYFGLCPKYIAKRTHTPGEDRIETPTSGESSQQLDADDIAQLHRSDTAFLASYNVDHGADATHRGGQPGFLRVIDPNTIEIPDYFGNMMFNTIGNLVLDNRLGFTDIDFETGRTVQVTGVADVSHDVDREFHGDAERLLTLKVDKVITSYAPVGQWSQPEPSNFSSNYPGRSQP